MRKITITLSLLFCGLLATAQNGLENIIVEKYYVSNANDTTNIDGGFLPVGSKTYRIYVDMLPGYKFQAAYGIPGHELRLETTTLFFNNIDRGATTPTYTKAQAANNTVMLDSWLSAGAACVGNVGVLKSDDDGIATVVNADGILQNNDTAAHIPLTLQDGLKTGSTVSATLVGLDSVAAIFDAETNGSLFSTTDGSWAALGGSMGADTLTNKVLIAQMTTTGIFSFKLNIQIGTPTGGVQNFVAENPVDSTEIVLTSLSYTSPADTITDTSTVGIKNIVSNALVNIYPNPAKDVVTIEVSNSGSHNNSYSIYNAEGMLIAERKIMQTTSKYTERVDVSSYPQGLYFVVLSLDGVITSKKIIKN